MNAELQRLITLALAEDIGSGDITSQLLIPESAQAEMTFVAREEMVACGIFILAKVYGQLASPSPAQRGRAGEGDAQATSGARIGPLPNPPPRRAGEGIATISLVKEGQRVAEGTILTKATGPARALLAGERVALNFMQRMCGVATLTAKYVEAVRGTKAVILDTRKTMPGMRALDKYAVRCGGGQNHRMGLYDAVLVKDNHIALSGGVGEAVRKVRGLLSSPTFLPPQAGGVLVNTFPACGRGKVEEMKIIVECDTLFQVEEALNAMPDRILLDNMDIKTLREAVKLAARKVPLEASGGVSLENVRAIAETGVDYISAGKLTHSAPAADIGADVVIRS